MAVEVSRRRFTADEYQQMGRAGILWEGDRLELIDGDIVAMTPIGPRHSAVVDRLARAFFTAAGEAAIVRIQGAIRLNPHTEPQPDLTLLRPRADFYSSAHPTAADILLIVEVAHASAGYDRTVKAELYARFGIDEYWLVDLTTDTLTRHLDPVGGAYRGVSTLRPGEQWAPGQLPACRLSTRDIFG